MRFTKTTLLLTMAVATVSFNLRTIAVAIGPVLPELRADLGMSPTLAGLLTAMPTLCFALFGFLALPMAARWGLHRSALIALGGNLVGQVVRILANQTLGFFAGTIIALAGIGVINVLMPPLVKAHFPTRNGLLTAVYVTSQSIGLTLASLYTAPLAIALGGWRAAFWSWLITAALGVPLMAWATRRFHEPQHRVTKTVTVCDAARTRLGWMMMVFFGMQSAQAYAQFGWLPTIYQDAGFSSIEAGSFLTIVTALGIPLSFVVPTITYRLRRPIWLLALMTACGMAGYLGLLIDPARLAWLWPALLAVAGGCFPMILVLIGLHSSTPAGTAALSSFTQSAGYVLAALGPFLIGALKDATGSFFWPLLLQVAMFVPLVICGTIAIKSGTLEEELDLPPSNVTPTTS